MFDAAPCTAPDDPSTVRSRPPDLITELSRRARLLTAEEEVALARWIEAGLAAEHHLRSWTCDADNSSDQQRQRDLELVAQEGRQAFRLMVVCNLRLVVSVVRTIGRYGFEFADLVQEGNLGLIRAVQMFDHRRGYKFSTYATWWIRQAITRAMADRGRCVRLPVHVVEKQRRAEKSVRTFVEAHGRPPAAAELDADPTLRTDVELLARLELTEVVSLDALLDAGDDEVETVLGRLMTPGADDEVLDDVAFGWTRSDIHALLDRLKPRERTVIELRFGIGGSDPLTLEQIGALLGVTRERVRQLERKALDTLTRFVGRTGAAPAAAPRVA